MELLCNSTIRETTCDDFYFCWRKKKQNTLNGRLYKEKKDDTSAHPV